MGVVPGDLDVYDSEKCRCDAAQTMEWLLKRGDEIEVNYQGKGKWFPATYHSRCTRENEKRPTPKRTHAEVIYENGSKKFAADWKFIRIISTKPEPEPTPTTESQGACPNPKTPVHIPPTGWIAPRIWLMELRKKYGNIKEEDWGGIRD